MYAADFVALFEGVFFLGGCDAEGAEGAFGDVVDDGGGVFGDDDPVAG